MITHINVGSTASITAIFTEKHLVDFSVLSQDFNPIHLDSEFAEKSIFGRKIVHGMLVASLFSGLLGSKLPGQGSIYLGQTLKFTSPVYLGDEVTATVEVINVRTDKPIVTLRTYCCNADGILVIDGEAIMKI
jgi:acyl dehydratase